MSFIRNYGLHEPTLDDWGLETPPITKKETDEEIIGDYNASIGAEMEEIKEKDRRLKEEEEEGIESLIRKEDLNVEILDYKKIKEYFEKEA